MCDIGENKQKNSPLLIEDGRLIDDRKLFRLRMLIDDQLVYVKQDRSISSEQVISRKFKNTLESYWQVQQF